jgi:hypothetical protein
MTGKVSKNSDLLMMSLSSFYAQRGMMLKIMPIVNGTSKYSLRLIDWFVTNYAKKHNTIINYKSADNNFVHFNVYLSYRSQLKAYSKQQFDPFRRRERILFYYERDKSVETTIGQLNFFRWVVQNHLLDYIMEHAKEIEKDMVTQQKPRSSSQSPGQSSPPNSGQSSQASQAQAPGSGASSRGGSGKFHRKDKQPTGPRPSHPPPHATSNTTTSNTTSDTTTNTNTNTTTNTNTNTNTSNTAKSTQNRKLQSREQGAPVALPKSSSTSSHSAIPYALQRLNCMTVSRSLRFD